MNNHSLFTIYFNQFRKRLQKVEGKMMKDKTVIVTGGSSGMGKAMAQRFANDGANVMITGRSEQKLEDAKLEMMETETGKEEVFSMDVLDFDEIDRIVENNIKTSWSNDHLVNNAAGNVVVQAEDLTVNGWISVIDIVLSGTFYCRKADGAHWIEEEKRGSILNMVATYAWDA